jgi:rhodanese-related sulfurtransferase
VKSLPPTQFRAALDRARASGPVVLLDVREESETARGQVDGAELMPWNSGEFARDHGRLPKDRPVFIYCARGNRSMKAAQLLVSEGWTDVTSLTGGYEDYRLAFPPR